MDKPRALPDGRRDLAVAAATLAGHLPPEFAPLATLAYNYWWSWAPGGEEVFSSLDPHRWLRCGMNPVRLLQELDPSRLRVLAMQPGVLPRIEALARALRDELGRPERPITLPGRPAVIFCAEFGVHRSLPFYAGGLGVLAGDFLKELSGQGYPAAGIGLFYSQGSFHHRVDSSGWQHEFWLDTDSDRLPAAIVTGADGEPLTVNVPIRGRDVTAQIWRVDVGRVPLYLLDTNLPGNAPGDRWITSRLYVGNREVRLAQYALLGIGGVRAMRAMGIEPALIHLNEGHASLALLELLREQIAAGLDFTAAKERVRAGTVFTTHTPVAAGNETLSTDDLRSVLPDLPASLGIEWAGVVAMGRIRPGDPGEQFGLTPFALRMTGAANAVSRLHGEVARQMWHDLWPGRAPEQVPIGHVTNGVHLATWMAPQMGALFARYLPGWPASAADPATWQHVDDIPDGELWAVRCELRAGLGGYVRDRSVVERLGRGEPLPYAESAARAWSDDSLTAGFARRIATYKRLYLVTRNLDRGLRLMNGELPVQLVIAGRAHPQDDDAKRTVQQIFALNYLPNLGGRVVFLEEHDMAMAARLVRGSDIWLNLPRPLNEASGTSGMKSALNGGLQLSVLDGWWAEAYDGANGWAIASNPALPAAEQDAQDATALFDLLESEVLPLFYDRDEDGIPHGWVQKMKTSLKSIGPRFTATRMLGEYVERARAQLAAPGG